MRQRYGVWKSRPTYGRLYSAGQARPLLRRTSRRPRSIHPRRARPSHHPIHHGRQTFGAQLLHRNQRTGWVGSRDAETSALRRGDWSPRHTQPAELRQ
ncbi:hypothetical protein GGTG_13396 [Gaeumannomyces tritici R3-111a-1]|uniref:Uncharacterized protein n=1 Tax=Gaeumannomyces tritici (strain R3-111a-1) TaxID=644352 RepID=J3PIR7_GAET3|nr:hypothetical protein GGTG_13396 [Gaeumannomyces tritici R3-111a-1]EJT68999.1 hypothetical protein GGTG_13396 [Gaeumannomyces tritici R3-111a-1]